MLHDVPAPDKHAPSLERRRGYRALQAEEDVTIEEETREEEEAEREEEREIARKEGWMALGWRFAVSASMTVRADSLRHGPSKQ